MNRIINYFKSINVEMKKVSWLTKKQLVNSTIIVLVFALIISTFLFVLDFGLSEVVKVIFNLKIN